MDIELSLLIKNRMYHEGISLYLHQQKDFKHLRICESVESLFPKSASNNKSSRPILLTDENAHQDLAMLSKLKREQPLIKIVMVMYSPNANYIAKCMDIGIEGVITENDSMQDLKTCIYTVDSGHICYPKACLSHFMNKQSIVNSHLHAKISTNLNENPTGGTNRLRRFSDLVASSEFLTSKQMKIVELLEQGLSNKEIARVLCIEISTVKNHVHRILEKLHLKNRCEAGSWFRNQQTQRLSNQL